MDLTKLSNDEIKVGDIVGILEECHIGWKCYRYDYVHKIKIARITPARTKFVSDDGMVFNKYQRFYTYNEEAQRWNELAEMASKISKNISLINNTVAANVFRNVPDERIGELLQKTEEIKKIMEVVE